MKGYTVKQLAELAGVSVRTLHHYDQVGLLQPGKRSGAGYRIYGQDELYRLQQILFYRELGYSLKATADILNDPGFDLVGSLEFQKKQLQKQSTRVSTLIDTINKTIVELKRKDKMLTNEELYEGLPKEKAEAYRKEAMERWGGEVTKSEDRLRQMSKAELREIKAKGDQVTRKLASLMNLGPADSLVQKAIGEHFEYMQVFYPVTDERYRGLGRMYVEDERFTATYDQYKPGLALFIHQAIEVFCDQRSKQ